MNSIPAGASGIAPPSLDRLLRPRAIAVIGASPDAVKLAGRPLAYLRRYGYRGAVYAVNPKYAQIDGTPCVASVDALPDGVDLALILLPAPAVADTLEACGRRGIPYAISIASGFAEAGAHDEQCHLRQLCEQHGIRLIGPNCVGLIQPRDGVAATFSSELRNAMPRPGAIALLTQSGALGNSLLQSFNDLGIGLAAWVSTGNEADLGLLDLVEHFVDDAQTRLIVLYIEGLNDGHRLLPLARRARAAGKAIVALRAGRSQLGRSASVSHTGKLAGAWKVWRDVAAQAGLIEVDSLDSLVDLALAFDRAGAPRADAPLGLGVLTVSGGLGVLISDAAAACGVALPPFAARTQTALRELLPPQMSVANPVDTALFADERGYATCARAVLADPGIGALLLVLTRLAHDYDAVLPDLLALAERARDLGKCLAVTFLSSSDLMTPAQRDRLLAAGAIVLPTAERVVQALGRRAALRCDAGVPVVLPTPPRASLHEASVEAFLRHAGVPRVPEQLCTGVDDAVAHAERYGYPVVLKVASPDIAHKSEAGGVALGLADAQALRGAWYAMVATVAQRAPGARIDGYVVQPQWSDGVELIVGCSVDPELGRVAMVGAGGIWAEILDDVRFLGLPAAEAEIRAALDSLRMAPLMAGARGRPAVDVDAAVGVIARLAQAFHDATWVREVDLNPLLVRPGSGGAVALDVLVVPTAA